MVLNGDISWDMATTGLRNWIARDVGNVPRIEESVGTRWKIPKAFGGNAARQDLVRNSDISMFLGGYSSTPDFFWQIQAARPDFMCQLHSGSRFMWQSRFLDTNCWWRQKEDISPRHRIKTAWILCFLPSNICVSENRIYYDILVYLCHLHSGKTWNTKYPWNPHCGYITTRYPHVCG